MEIETKNFHIYIDGSAMPNPGVGASGFIVYDSKGNKITEGIKLFDHITNNQAELEALLLIEKKYLNKNNYIYSDSNYLVEGYNNWYKKWSWIGDSYYKKQKKIENSYLWKKILALKNLKIKWVKAHHNNIYNNAVDKLIQNANKKRL